MAYGRPDLDLLHIYAVDKGHDMPKVGTLRQWANRGHIERRSDGWYDIGSVMKRLGWDKDAAVETVP